MQELISKKKAIADLRGIKDVLVSQGDPFLASVMNRAIKCLENQKVLYAVEAAQGQWIDRIDNDTDMHECSVCGARVVKGLYEYENPNRYCYHCGAKMDGERNNK